MLPAEQKLHEHDHKDPGREYKTDEIKRTWDKDTQSWKTNVITKSTVESIYDYDEDIRALLYQFKGCFDYELRSVFFDRYFNELRLRYVGYYIIPIPSYIKDDEIRGFNHVIEIFSQTKIKMLKIIEKTDHFKQADHNKEQRAEISKHLRIIGNPDLRNKKVLIVDDVYSTGSTMKATIHLVEQLHPKKIEILVMAKTRDEKYNKKSN